MIAQEHLWIATEKGLVRYNLSRRSIDTPNLPLPLLQTAIQHLSLDSDGNLWGQVITKYGHTHSLKKLSRLWF